MELCLTMTLAEQMPRLAYGERNCICHRRDRNLSSPNYGTLCKEKKAKHIDRRDDTNQTTLLMALLFTNPCGNVDIVQPNAAEKKKAISQSITEKNKNEISIEGTLNGSGED